ncbi:YfhJ family protein [Pseudalkalibacillus caeni]|uniref:WVELL protein n=1 Tax=Exobacillus caeni TaxID=2574798 RepID=A0A5R9EZZ3_9BACL|nr:YfhJ family protein [Pseudalkalibacillus caeni]TLS35710.1 hypothetical protein FCL54_18810 [Pseudalkalibacillus caeni]
MDDVFEKLTFSLLEKNDQLSYAQARTMIELLWEDFETTRAKAGHEYRGPEVTEKIVKQWIENYGPMLHEFISRSTKYHDIIGDDNIQH